MLASQRSLRGGSLESEASVVFPQYLLTIVAYVLVYSQSTLSPAHPTCQALPLKISINSAPLCPVSAPGFSLNPVDSLLVILFFLSKILSFFSLSFNI